MKPRVLTCIILLCSFQLFAADYYWVGGGGNWSDLGHWRLGSSAGSIPSIVPSTADNVFFGSYSGFGATAPTRTVTLNANGYCNNFTWESGVANNPVFITANATAFKLEVWGNMQLSPTTTYTVMFVLRGATASTLTTNGDVLGQFGMEIDKPGGTLTLADNLVVPSTSQTATNSITLIAGAFNASGKTVQVLRFNSSGTGARSLDISNGDFTTYYQYSYTGTNKVLNAAGSVLTATGYFSTEGDTYNIASSNARDANNFSIFNTTFTKLTFTNPILTSEARIHDGNTVDTLIFMGSGYIRNNNTVKVVDFAGSGGMGTDNHVERFTALGAASMANNNTIGYLKTGGTFTISIGSVTNTVDSLLLAPSQVVTLRGAFNINKYLQLNGAPCDAYTEVNGDPVNGAINFANGAVVDINNMILTGVKATGDVTPITISGVDGGENAGFTINAPASSGTTLYWVNGPGDWNDRSHWSTTSGGAGGACVPFMGDDVVFDANSGLASGTITTSSSSFCHNMTWTGIGTITFNESTTSTFSIYGSLVMDNSVTMNALLQFAGTESASITTNATTTGSLQFIIIKTGGAIVSMTDDWNNTTGGSLVHRSGGLNLSDRTLNLVYFSGIGADARSLDISNATLSFTQYWNNTGANKTMDATGSHITSNGGFGSDGLHYPWVDLTGTAGIGIGFLMSNTSFGQLNFTNTSATSAVHAGSNNTIRRLEFKGKGGIGTNNNIDSLILAGSRIYTCSGTIDVNAYLMAESTTCSGLIELRGPATMNFASGAEIHMNNVYLQGMTATGQNPTFSGADAGGNTGWTINVATGGDRFWVNGSGDWNDPSHWSATSGGTGGTACVPTVYDNVYFDAGSGFTSGSNTVTINNGNAYCNNIDWTGAANNPVFTKSSSFEWEVWGESITFNPATTITASFMNLKGSKASTINGGAPAGNFDFRIDKAGGSVTLLDDYINAGTTIAVTNGAFNASGRTLTVDNIDNESLANATSIDISNANVTTDLWEYAGVVTNHALNAENSVLTVRSFVANGFNYNRVNISGSVQATINNLAIDSLVFEYPNTASATGIAGSGNTLNYVEYKGAGGIYGTNNTIDTLVFFPGNRYVLNSGTNTTITGAWYGSGTPCRLTEIVSSSTGNATITKASGDVSFDYVRLQRITGTGGAAYSTQSHSIDLGGNTNWTMAPYDGAAPIQGLGPDTAAYANEFPIVLQTDGFFGAPGSQYLWSDNSTADTLLVTEAGTYYLNVSFPDGCNISDTIVVNLNTLPITITSFTATVKNCQTRLSWKTADALQFSHFVVEQSTDGNAYTEIGQVNYAEGIENYSFTDNSPGNGVNFYRLKLVDIDRKFEYSAVASVRSDCSSREIQVRPTVTHNNVQVTLPAGFENARLYIINAMGQQIAPVIHGHGTVRTVSLQGLPAATYMLQVVNGNDIKTYRILKR